MRRLAFVSAIVLATGLAASAVSGCKQKDGERCQIDDDCETGHLCAKGPGICVPSLPDAGGNIADAHPADASFDARPVDATPDAP
jgi:hypothetical protein